MSSFIDFWAKSSKTIDLLNKYLKQTGSFELTKWMQYFKKLWGLGLCKGLHNITMIKGRNKCYRKLFIFSGFSTGLKATKYI